MKKIIFITVLAAISLIACNKSEETDPSDLTEKSLSQKFKDQPYTYLQNKYMDSVLIYQYEKQTRSYNPANFSYDEKLEEILLIDSIINNEARVETNADVYFYENLERELMKEINSHPYIQKFVANLALKENYDKNDMMIYTGYSDCYDAISKFEILRYYEDGVDILDHYLKCNELAGDEEWNPFPFEDSGQKGVRYTLHLKWGSKIEYMWNAASSSTKTGVISAMADWKSAANNKISFSEITTNVGWNKTCWIMGWKYFIRISTVSSGNFSGRSTLGKVPWAIMDFKSTANTRTFRHELGHNLGLYHEHQRPDRDTYITYKSSNVQSGMGSQFSKMTAGSYNYYSSTFDFNSIMLYRSFAYSKTDDGNPANATMLKKDGSIFYAPTDISSTDKNVIRQIYN